MNFLPKVVWISLLVASFFLSLTPASTAQKAQIRHVAVVKSGDGMQIEIQTSQRVMPLTQVVTDPDRLIIDFSDTIPGPELRAVTVNKGAVKAVRVGRVTINPPVTRVVIDLTAPLPFQLFPSSRSVIVKLGDAGIQVASAPEASPPPAEAPVVKPAVAVAAPARALKAVSVRPAAVAPEQMPSPAPAAMAGITVSRWPVGSGNAQVKKVAVLKSGDATEIEIETSQRVEPAVQTVTGPDRLVIDFPQSLPGPQLRPMAVNRGEVKGVRVGLLSSNPPVTRVVLDLKSAQVYQVFPSAKSVIVKLPTAAGGTLAPSSASITEAGPAAPPPPPKKVEIKLQDDKMSLVSNKASLAEVLNEVHAQLNADIPIPAGAEQELVAVVLGPGTQREVISKLLEGSRYNFIIVGTDQDANKVERVILSPKTPGGVVAGAGGSMEDTVPVAQMQTPPQRSTGAPPPPPPPVTEDEQPQGDSNPPPDTTPQPGDPQAPPN
jgi:AMIN domain-containing protein